MWCKTTNLEVAICHSQCLFLKGLLFSPILLWVHEWVASLLCLLWSQLLCVLFNKLAVSISQINSWCDLNCWHAVLPPFLPHTLSPHLSLSLYQIRERSWGMWTIIFSDILKWIDYIHFRNFWSDCSMPEWGWISNMEKSLEQEGLIFCSLLFFFPVSESWGLSGL